MKGNYYPASNFYPPKFYEIYAAKYTRVHARDIVLSMSWGHHVKVGTLLFTITPLQSTSQDAQTTIKPCHREFLIDGEIIYNAGSYIRDEPAIRYLDEPDNYNHHSWELPPINAFYLEKIQLKANFSKYYSSGWSFSGGFRGTYASNWKGPWILNGNIHGDNKWDAYMSKSERAQFVAEGVDVEQNLHEAYLRWKEHLLNQIENDRDLLKKYNEYSMAMSSSGYLLNLLFLGAEAYDATIPGLGISQIIETGLLHHI